MSKDNNEHHNFCVDPYGDSIREMEKIREDWNNRALNLHPQFKPIDFPDAELALKTKQLDIKRWYA